MVVTLLLVHIRLVPQTGNKSLARNNNSAFSSSYSKRWKTPRWYPSHKHIILSTNKMSEVIGHEHHDVLYWSLHTYLTEYIYDWQFPRKFTVSHQLMVVHSDKFRNNPCASISCCKPYHRFAPFSCNWPWWKNPIFSKCVFCRTKTFSWTHKVPTYYSHVLLWVSNSICPYCEACPLSIFIIEIPCVI